MIDALRKQYDALAADNAVACSASNAAKTAKQTKTIEKSLAAYTAYRDRIARATASLKETDHQIKKIEKQVLALRPKQITDQQCQIRVKSGRKTIETLKNTLDNAIKRFCVTLSENRSVRDEINHLLKERERFNRLYEENLRKLEEKKRRIFDLVERATLTYDQREEWCNKLSALHMRTHADALQHKRAMRELQRRLDYDTGLHEFLQVKGQRRIMRDLEIKERVRKDAEREKAAAQLKEYEETLATIKELTGERNVRRLTTRYTKQEEENFALFNYVSELSAELEDLEGAIRRLNEDIQEQCDLNEIRAKQQEKGVGCLREELEEECKGVVEAQVALEGEKGRLQRFLEGVEELFRVLGCEKGAALELFGGDAKITDHNVFVYLEMIEKRIESVLLNRIDE